MPTHISPASPDSLRRYETWENVWGTWNGITPRDAEAIRRVGHMQRFFGAEAGGGLLLSAGWEPHTPEAVQPAVFASRWPDARGRRVLWTLVNRGEHLANGTQLVVAAPSGGARWFDCYRGTELTARVASGTDGGATATASLSFPLGGGGYGCALQTGREAPDGALSAFLAEMAAMTKAPLDSYSAEWRVMQQRLRPVLPSPPAASPPPGAVALPAARSFLFSTRGLEIEGDDAHGVDAQFPWEEAPRREHSHTLAVPPLFIDRHPVTTANYSAYRRATGYSPKDPLNWLNNWRPGWPFTTPPGPAALPPKSPPPRMADWPVTYVSLDEARDYCTWAGGRLPRAWEWQYAAQGTDGRLYPWGNHTCDSCWPAFSTGNTFLGPEPVTAHSPAGDSPFGVADLTGNVWQYTDEIADEHTRSVLLRGGSNYRPDGSHWYFPNRGGPGSGPPCTTHNKYFLFGESYERAGTVGFRCVYDRPAPTTPPLGADRSDT
mmetsp:Transcript_36020/g.113120  ORF Transcript_36020/g.113120 Transcript_36020/m.113120 type:complete len:491 (-) Transcript_36020:434-1906(-)